MIGSQGVGGGVMPLHETAHALDFKTNRDGTKVSGSTEFNKAYRQVMAPPNLANPYYKQAGSAGREELFATSTAVVLRARQIGMVKAREEGDVRSPMYDPAIKAAQDIIEKRGW